MSITIFQYLSFHKPIIMKQIVFSLLFLALLQSCNTKTPVDLIIYNANIYTVDDNFSKAEAMAIKDGKLVAVGTSEDITNSYTSDVQNDINGQTILPGFIDAHCHFYNLGIQQQRVDLVGTKSFSDVVERVTAFQKEKNVPFITGRGWDQNDWDVKEFPNKDTLDVLFPDTPVALTRIDGHALIANKKALELAGITNTTKVEGGEVELKDGKLTGILIDNPMSLVRDVVPKPGREQQIAALMEAQDICFSYGLTTVDDAGLSKDEYHLIDSLQQAGDLKMRVYGMISNTEENLDYYLNKGIIKTDRLNIRSVKVYADGALGSRGAALKQPYSDKGNHFGAMVIGPEDFKTLAERIAASDYQMNTHAIGDSANIVVLRTYDKLLSKEENRRWRVEHAQIITDQDFDYFSTNIIPSVQPTHATSDMYWAEDRVGEERIKGAYAYNTLLDQAGIVALGTDFPVEQVSPFLTFYAAVARQDTSGFPEGGFNMKEALTREETLKGMTIWAAFSNFEEDEKGSLEAGKFADFIVLNENIMEVEASNIPSIKVLETYVNGEQVN